MCYSLQLRDRIFVKGCELLSFAKNTIKNITEIISKNFRGKYSQKLLDHAKQSTADVFKTTSKRAILKTAEATGYLIGNIIGDSITKVSKDS